MPDEAWKTVIQSAKVKEYLALLFVQYPTGGISNNVHLK